LNTSPPFFAPRLSPHLALQPLIIHNENPIYTRHVDQKRYELTDHLGNVRSVVSDMLLADYNLPLNTDPTNLRAKVVSRSDYYPFGSLLPGRNYSSGSYRFGFNGKENDNEVHDAPGTFQDYGMRAYDTRVGRFFSVDPLAAKYPWYTPYQFAGNQPIWAVDLDGAEELIIIRWFDNAGGYQGETALRVPLANREASKRGNGDSQIMDMNISQRPTVSGILNGPNRNTLYAMLQDGSGQYQGNYRAQFSPLDAIKNRKVIANEADPGIADYQDYSPLPRDLNFNFDDSDPTKVSSEQIQLFNSWLDIEPDRKVDVVGYASQEYDPKLTPEQGLEYNMNLSLKRAQEAADYLTANGIPADRIRSVIGAGPTTQFGPNLDDNRRVQLVFTYEQQP
jgi:RHS repeat-associated protein